MTVKQLIQRLSRLDPDMPVVVKANGHKLQDDFVDLKISDLVTLVTKELYTIPYWGGQVYDASEGNRERKTKVLSLSGGTWFQRGDKNEL